MNFFLEWLGSTLALLKLNFVEKIVLKNGIGSKKKVIKYLSRFNLRYMLIKKLITPENYEHPPRCSLLNF